MAAITQIYPKQTAGKATRLEHTRTGGPRGEQPEAANEIVEYIMSTTPFGSHMPLDTQMHWDWRNPLNIIPAFMLLLFLLTVIGLLVR